MAFGETREHREERIARQRARYRALDLAGGDFGVVARVDNARRARGEIATPLGLQIERTLARSRPPGDERTRRTSPDLTPDEIGDVTTAESAAAGGRGLTATEIEARRLPQFRGTGFIQEAELGGARRPTMGARPPQGFVPALATIAGTGVFSAEETVNRFIGDPDRPLGTAIGEQIERTPVVGRQARAAVDAALAPATVGSAALAAPFAPAGFAGALAVEAAGAAAGEIAGREVAERTDNPWLAAGAGVLAGAVVGGAAAGGIRHAFPMDVSGLSVPGARAERAVVRVTPDVAGGIALEGGEQTAERAAARAASHIQPPPALRAVFGATDVDPALSRRASIQASADRVLPLRTPDEELVSPLFAERARIIENASSLSAATGARVRSIVADTFEIDGTGRIPTLANRMFPQGPGIRDVADRLPEFNLRLTPAQHDAMIELRSLIEPYRSVIDEAGLDVGTRRSVIPGGFYLPRGSAVDLTEDIPERVVVGASPRGRRGFERAERFASEAAGIQQGLRYQPVDEAIADYISDVAERATNTWMARVLKEQSFASGFGARLQATGWPERMATLRQQLSQRRRTLSNRLTRESARTEEAERAARAAGAAGERVATSEARLAELPVVAAADATAARRAVRDAVTEGRRIIREAEQNAQRIRGAEQALTAKERQLLNELEQLGQTLDQADALVGTRAGRVAFASDAPRTAAAKAAREEAGRLGALADIRTAIDDAPDVFEALERISRLNDQIGRELTVRADPGLRLADAAAARLQARGGRRAAAKSVGLTGDANIGEGAFDILAAHSAALDEFVESAAFDVVDGQSVIRWAGGDTRSLPPAAELADRIRVATDAGTGVLPREYADLLRQADRIQSRVDRLTPRLEALAGRVDDLTERGTILGELDQSARSQLVTAQRAERLLARQDRDLRLARRELALLQREESRAARASTQATRRAGEESARVATSTSQVAALEQTLDSLADDWKRVKELARQQPPGRGEIALSELRGTDFPLAIANAANAVLAREQPLSGRGAGVLRTANAVNNLYRGLRSTADNSAVGIQGLLGAADDPQAFSRALSVNARAWGRNGDTVLGSFLRDFDRNAIREGLATSDRWARNGLHFGGAQSEFAIGQGVLERLGQLPGFRQANRAFGYMGDALRPAWAQDELAELMARTGRSLDDLEAAGELRRIATALNGTTGWSGRRAFGDFGELALFAPRYLQSRLETLARVAIGAPQTFARGEFLPGFGQGVPGLRSIVPAARTQNRIAARSMLRLIGTGTVLTVAVNDLMNGGIGQPFSDTDFRPLVNGRYNTNFMRIRLGGRDWSAFGPWDSLARAIVLTAQGKPHDAARGMASGLAANLWNVVTGEDAIGQRVPNSWPEIMDDPRAFGAYLLEQVTPFSAGELPGLASETAGDIREVDIQSALLRAPILAGELLGLKSSPLSLTDLRDEKAKDLYGQRYGELEPFQQHEIDSDPEIAEAQRTRRENARDQSSRLYAEQSELAKRQQQADDELLAEGRLSIDEWKDGRTQRNAFLRGYGEGVFGGFADRAPRNALERYWQAIDERTDPATGRVDWDAVDRWRGEQSDEDNAYIDRNSGLNDTPFVRQRREVAAELDATGFFEIREAAWAQVQERFGIAESYDDYRRALILDLRKRLEERGMPPGAALDEAEKLAARDDAIKARSDIANQQETIWIRGNPALADRARLTGYIRSFRAEERQAISGAASR